MKACGIVSKLLFISVLLLGSLGTADAGVDRYALELVKYYADLVQSGNFESARGMWDPSATLRAERLGIELEGIPLKADCHSPIINSVDRINPGLYPGVKLASNLGDDTFRMNFSATIGNKERQHVYYAKRLGQDYWLFFPQDFYCRDWHETTSKYFRFYIDDNKGDYFSIPGADELDRFVESTAELLDIPDSRLKILEQQKTDYYLCNSELEIGKITGFETRSWFDPAADAIFTSDFPDFHMAAKQLINFKLQKLPLYNIPLMGEGFPIYLGGRWQRSSQVITDFGRYIIDNDLAEIDSVLVEDNDQNATLADITYPVDACLIDYFIEKLGLKKFLEMYRNLGGDIQYRDTVSADWVRATISKSLGRTWPEILGGFSEFLENRPDRGGLIYPGQKIKKNILLTREDRLMLYADKKWFQVKYFVPDSTNGVLHFVFDKNDRLVDKESSLFNEQYKGKHDLGGYRWGIMIDKNEIGLYDYAANQLKAKYVESFDPNKDYYNKDKKVITAYFSLDLFNGEVPHVEDGIFIEQD